MSSSVLQRSTSLSPTMALALVLLGLGVAPAAAGDRCEGTLCDLYYDHVASPTPPATAASSAAQPTPITVPSTGLLGRLFSAGNQQQPAQPGAQVAQPSASQPATTGASGSRFVAVQGGGLVGMMRGAPQERCSGTLCDLYYGGPPPEEPASARAEAVAAEPMVDEPAAEPNPARIAEPVERHCASARDPWSCYR